MTRLPETRASSIACKFCVHPATQSNANNSAAAAARFSVASKVPRRHAIQMTRNPAVLRTSLHSSARLAAQLVAQ